MPAQPVATRFDVALAGALAVLVTAELTVPFSTVSGEGSAWLAAGLSGLAASALVVRRRYPLAVLTAAFVPLAVLSLLVPVLVLFWGGLLPMCVAVYSVARYGQGRTPYVGGALAALSLFGFTVGTGMITKPNELFFPWLVLSAAWLAGLVIHRMHAAAVSSEQRAREVEAASRRETMAALAEERGRIARELHDIVAHSVTAMVVQAGAAGEVVEEDPEYVRKSLDRIRQTGSEALDEMRRVVALLRDSGDPEPADPQPGLADLGTLVERAGNDLTRVVLDVEGEPRALPLGADLAAYRIVQEALTNVHRHAAASEVHVAVRYRSASIEVEVCDNGIGRRSTSRNGAGHGLVGMRERASMYGGEVQVVSAPGEGFRVKAVLPVEEAV